MGRRRPSGAGGDLLAGTLDMLILRTVSAHPAHGFAIAQQIQQRSADALLVEEGSLYPALYRLEERGWISAVWGVSENNRRARFYRITPKGRAQLTAEATRWESLVRAVGLVMRSAEE